MKICIATAPESCLKKNDDDNNNSISYLLMHLLKSTTASFKTSTNKETNIITDKQETKQYNMQHSDNNLLITDITKTNTHMNTHYY